MGVRLQASTQSAEVSDTRSPGPASSPSPVTIRDVVRFFATGARTALACALAGLLLGALAHLLLPRRYASEASFVVQSSEPRMGGALTSLATSFGLNIASGTRAPQYYVELLRTDEALSAIVVSLFRGSARDSVPLYEILEARGDSQAERVEHATRLLRERLATSSDPVTGLIRVRFVSVDPVLSAQVVQRALAVLDSLDLSVKRTAARAQTRFVEERVQESREQLRASEAALRSFIETNRRYEQSTQLTFEADRLRRDLSLREQLYTTLVQQLDLARIEAARNTPVLSVVDTPRVPVRPRPPGLLLKMFIGAMVLMCGWYLYLLVRPSVQALRD